MIQGIFLKRLKQFTRERPRVPNEIRSGANAYHVKPLQYPDHLQALEQIFGYWPKSAVLPT